MTELFLEIALFVCKILILAKISISTISFSLDHREVTEPAYQAIYGGKEASPSLGRWEGAGSREVIKPARLAELGSVEERSTQTHTRFLAGCLGEQWAIN